MKRSRRKSFDVSVEKHEEGSRKKKVPRLDLWVVPQKLEKKLELCERLYEVLKECKGDEGQLLSEFLVRLPSRRSALDYYQLIEKPIDLLRIQQKLKISSYTAVSQFVSDVHLLVGNAKMYYMPPTEEYKRAVALEKEFLKSLQLYIETEVEPFSPISPKTVSLKLASLPSPVQATPTGSKSTPTLSKSASVASKSVSSPALPQKQVKIKTTRSKAWLEGYRASDDPIRIFYADVYSYHDAGGEYIAQPFIEMPSRKHYPEYYDVIVEPIDLLTIKANIDSNSYSTLKPIQDDLLLLIKNAHHFNEPGSFIYKMATTLRRFVVNRCLELERKYKTVKKSPPPVGEGLKNKRSPPPLGIDVPKSKRYSVGTAEESESGDDLSVSESEDEGGGGSKQRLLLKVKKEKLYKDQNPLEKVLKSKVRPKLKKLLLGLYRVLVNAETDDGRSISELFMRRPSPKLYPEYYIVIAKPIDFKEISKKIRDDQYNSLDSFMEDVELLVNNACTFNEEKSQIHSDALMLRKITLSSHEKLNKRWCAPVTIMDETCDDKISLVNSIKVLYLSLVNAKDMTGRNLWHTVREAPTVPEGSEASAKKCIGMSVISQKMEKGEYSSLDVLFSDLCALFDSYCEHHLPTSQPFKDAVMLHRISVTKYNDLTRDRKQAFKYPNVQVQVKKLLLEIVKKTLQYKDESGCVLSNALRNVTMCQEMPTKDDAKSRRVFSLEKIHQWASNGRYARLDQLQNDILLVLNKGREGARDNEMGVSGGRGMIRVCNALEKAYIEIRDRVCGNEGAGLCNHGNDGVGLWSPALKKSISDVVEKRELEKREKEVKQELVKKSKNQKDEEREGDEEKMDTSEQQLLEPIIPIDQRHFTDKLTVKGVVYEPGEYVYMPAREPHLPSQVSLIESLWTDDDGNEWFDGCWFPRPHETYHVASRKFYKKEIFKSDFYSSHRLAKAVGKCCVLYIKDYLKYQPEGFSDDDVFVCESRYLMKQKSMRKIKAWNIYYVHQHVLLPRTTPCSLNKVPSVFVTTTEESEGNDGLDPIPEQESGSVHSEERSEEEMREVSVQREDEEEQEGSDVFEMSFFEDLKEVPATVANPEENHTYFEQFCIDDKIFKLGDYVCVRSDQQHPYIARIDKMWTDKEGDPWFHGPWFVRMEETQHRPTRMFYEKELLLSNIQDTNPMRSIIRKSAVLSPADYIRLRPTEVLEKDVFVCESRYNEADKSIKKHKSLKTFQLSDAVIPNEIYYLPEELYLWKCHSPGLVSTPNCTPRPSQQPPPVAPIATPTPNPPTPVQATPTPAPMVTLPLPAGNITFTLPQLQALISSQLVGGAKPNPAPATSPQVGGTTPITTPLIPTPPVPIVTQPTTIIAYPCTWGSCNEIFEDSMDLGAHIVRSSHIVQEKDGYYCYWKGCPRTKSLSGKPFDTQQKITRHVKEVHMLRMMAQKVSVEDLGTNYHRRGLFINDNVRTDTTPIQHAMPQPTLPPQPLLAVGGQPLITPDLATLVPVVPAVATPTQATPTPVPPPEEVAKSKTTPPSVFVPPPKNIRPVIHSQIYQDYIKRLRTNEPTISPLESCPVPDTPPVPTAPPSQWVDEGCIPQGMTQVEALYRLRDALIGDAMKITKVLDAL